MKRPALQNKRVVVFRMAFRAQKVFGTFKKQAPGREIWIPRMIYSKIKQNWLLLSANPIAEI